MVAPNGKSAIVRSIWQFTEDGHVNVVSAYKIGD